MNKFYFRFPRMVLQNYTKHLVCVRLPLGHTQDVIQKTGNTQCTAFLSEEDGHRQHIREKFVKFGHVYFEICEQTDRQTDKLHACSSQYVAPLTVAK